MFEASSVIRSQRKGWPTAMLGHEMATEEEPIAMKQLTCVSEQELAPYCYDVGYRVFEPPCPCEVDATQTRLQLELGPVTTACQNPPLRERQRRRGRNFE